MAAITNLRKWKNGEVFNARDYVYERDAIITQVNRLSALIEGDGAAIDLTVDGLTTNSITLSGETITNFEDAGTKVVLSTAEPQIDDGKDGQIWIQFSD
jgi:hypothetical protein